jgi:hypothetical protein
MGGSATRNPYQPLNVPETPFTPQAIANAKLQPNPFRPGTNEYNDYQKAQVEQMKRSAGAPAMPDFVSQLDKNGNIKSNYNLAPGTVNFSSILPGVSNNINAVNIDRNALNALKDRALQTGPSAWLQLQNQNQGLDELNQVENAKQQAAGNNAQAEAQLAMRGGISSGARERMARAGSNSALQAAQGIRRQGQGDRTNLGIADENTKTGLLSQLPGMEQSYAQFDLGKQTYLGDLAKQQQGAQLDTQKYNADQATNAQKFNIQNSLNEILQKRAYDMGQYNETMKAWAADKTAEAQNSGGKK